MGVFVAANVMNALDGLSSPSGSAMIDGITTRGIAQSVLSLTMNEPLPNQGLGIARTSLIVDLLALALTGALVRSLVRMPRRYRRLAQHGMTHGFDMAKRSALIAALHFAWPAALLYLALTVPEWRELVLYQPDLTSWLAAVALLVFLKGGLELALAWRILGQTRRHSVV